MSHTWMPLYIADYLADTVHLTAAEHGAYLLLIMRYWQDGGLPSDERLIARYSRMTPDQWAESRDVIAALFDDGWKHGRIDEELARASDVISKRKAAASARYSKRDADEVHVQSTSTYARVPPSPTPSEAIASGAEAPPDERTKLFQGSLETLARMTGKPSNGLRSMLGRWLKQVNDDCRRLNRLIEDAAEANPADPIAFIEGAIKHRGQGPPSDGKVVAPVVFVPVDGPNWRPCSQRWEREKGKAPSALTLRNQGSPGNYFPADWLSAQPERTEA